jgi:steroid 5-alpha reductase family enzyme
MPAVALFLVLTAVILLGMAAVWLAVVKGVGSGWVDTVWSFLVGGAGAAAALFPVSGWEGD